MIIRDQYHLIYMCLLSSYLRNLLCVARRHVVLRSRHGPRGGRSRWSSGAGHAAGRPVRKLMLMGLSLSHRGALSGQGPISIQKTEREAAEQWQGRNFETGSNTIEVCGKKYADAGLSTCNTAGRFD